MKKYITKHYRVFGVIGAFVALAIATIYLFVVPEIPSNAGVFHKTILLYGHSACWILLGSASLLWALSGKNKWSGYLAYCALATYVIFMGTLVLSNLK